MYASYVSPGLDGGSAPRALSEERRIPLAAAERSRRAGFSRNREENEKYPRGQAVSKKDVEAVLERGVELLDKFLPLKSWLYFPILYAACVWAVRRVFDYRERLLAWEVWLDPEFVRTKPDEFVVGFFSGDPAIRREYAAEIAAGDMRVLRAAFPALYGVVGLDDAFLKALFKPELERGDFRALVVEFAARTARAREAIEPAASDPAFWRALETIGRNAASLGLHLLEDEEVQDLIIALIKGPVAAGPAVPSEA
jgi:hypothetical protein